MRRVLQLLVIALAVTGVAVGIGLLVTLPGDDGAPAATPPVATSAPPVALADLDTVHLPVQRGAFCDAVPPAAVATALGAAPQAQTSYVDHERGAVSATTTDVAHEYDCTWSAGSGSATTTARAWVFAPPVTPARATALARAQVRASSCEVLADGPAFGAPTAATRCATRAGKEISYRGLFGDAWFACSLTGPNEPDPTVPSVPGAPYVTLRDRAEAWCAAVVQAASGTEPGSSP